MVALSEDWEVLASLFPLIGSAGQEIGGGDRLRGFGSLEDVLHTLLLQVGYGWSLRETAVHARLAGIAEVSDVTIRGRFPYHVIRRRQP